MAKKQSGAVMKKNKNVCRKINRSKPKDEKNCAISWRGIFTVWKASRLIISN
jgi:hypothetical protein